MKFVSVAHVKKFLAVVICVSLVLSGTSSCSSFKPAKHTGYPMDKEDTRRAKRGKITGEGGLKLFGGGNAGQAGTSGVGVNTFLWRALLEILSFLPFTSVDPHGGVIITDWYEDPESRGERIKLNILILDTVLRVDAIKITVFKQKKNAGGVWENIVVSADTARELEDRILTRAREIRIQNVKSL